MNTTARIHETWNAVEGRQAVMFHDTILDAIGTAVAAVGGIDKAAGILWPSKPVSTASARLRECLNANREQKLSPEEVLHLAKSAREQGDHSIMNYMAAELGYEIKPISPRDQAAEMEQQISAGMKALSAAFQRYERLRGCK